MPWKLRWFDYKLLCVPRHRGKMFFCKTNSRANLQQNFNWTINAPCHLAWFWFWACTGQSPATSTVCDASMKLFALLICKPFGCREVSSHTHVSCLRVASKSCSKSPCTALNRTWPNFSHFQPYSAFPLNWTPCFLVSPNRKIAWDGSILTAFSSEHLASWR